MTWILVVVSDPDMRDMISLWLLRCGYQVICVEEANSATHLLWQRSIDLALIEARHIALNLDVLRILNRPDPSIPLLVMGHLSEQTAHLSGPYVDFIGHPYDIEEMRLRIHYLLERVAIPRSTDEA